MLSPTDVEKLVAAFANPASSRSIAALVARTGMLTASGVMLALETADSSERPLLISLVHAAIAESENGSLALSA